MSAWWYIFSSIGIYPMNPASGEYQIGSPIFEKSTITLADGKNS
jgi:putative alpha-1,2-mannosidase